MFVTQRRAIDMVKRGRSGEEGAGGEEKSHVSWEEVDLNENNGVLPCRLYFQTDRPGLYMHAKHFPSSFKCHYGTRWSHSKIYNRPTS